MSTLRTFALILGIVFIVVGICGFVPALVSQPPMDDTHTLSVHANHGYLLGLFPVNVLHNLVHILFGIWGVAAYATGASASRTFARGVCILYALLAIMGLIPGLNTTFGLIPIHGNDVWLHALIALVAGIFGWGVVGADARTTTTTGTADDVTGGGHVAPR
jgi:hypothetical protein